MNIIVFSKMQIWYLKVGLVLFHLSEYANGAANPYREVQIANWNTGRIYMKDMWHIGTSWSPLCKGYELYDTINSVNIESYSRVGTHKISGENGDRLGAIVCNSAGFKDKFEFIGLKPDYVRFMAERGYLYDSSVHSVNPGCIPSFMASEVFCDTDVTSIRQEKLQIKLKPSFKRALTVFAIEFATVFAIEL